MALTSDGMESETRHGELAGGRGQLMDFVHDETAQCQFGSGPLERLLTANPQALPHSSTGENENAENTCLAAKNIKKGKSR